MTIGWFRFDEFQGSPSGFQALLAALEKLMHVPTQKHRRELFALGGPFDFAQVKCIGTVQVDHTTRVVNGADAFLIVKSECCELHRCIPYDETT
jgi:hypothetical protein